MKHFLFAVAAIIAAMGLQAQQKDIPANIRLEVAEAEVDNAQYSIFIYKDDDGTVGYYLGLGGSSGVFAITENDNVTFSIQDVRETCIWLGATTEEVFASIDTLLALYDREPGTVVEFRGRTTTGAERLAESNSTTCEVKKRLLGGKRLLFSFASGRFQCGVYLTKGVVKQLRFGLKTNMKLNPKLHR